jgi:hypothetical protein
MARQRQHVKRNPHFSKRYFHKEVRSHRYYDDHHRRPAPRRKVIYKVAKKDPLVVFKIILKDHRQFFDSAFQNYFPK